MAEGAAVIKGTMGKGKELTHIVIGLEFENLNRLREGDPILFDLAEIGLPPMKVFIFAGASQDAMVAEFEKRGMITDATKVHDGR